MSARPYSKILNFAWYQTVWFTAILGGAALEWLLGLFMLMHLALVRLWRRELALMAAVAVVGVALDSLLAAAGYFQFTDTGWLPIPLWHVAIWIGFAGTLRHSMQFMVGRPRLMMIAAAVFAPLTYLAAQRFGAVAFPLGNFPTAVAVGLCWLTVTPILVWLTALANGEILRTEELRVLTTSTQEQSL